MLVILCYCYAECTVFADITLILDMSGSDIDFYDAMYTFSRLLAASLPIDSGAARFAVVTFSTSPPSVSS
jgi:hypothetical protein